MTATTSSLAARHGKGIVELVRLFLRAAGSLGAAIGSGWRRLVDAGDMGPQIERSISRHTGARI